MATASHIHIGVDFDNTIVAYDTLFHKIAFEQGLIQAGFPVSKSAVRDYLRSRGKDPAFTAMQGLVYGSRILEAEPFPGVIDFFSACAQSHIPISIISHKTREPIAGEPCDLHASAVRWLEQWEILNLIPEERVYFELTRPAKLERIRITGCTHFIDDLPELLMEAQFPRSTQRILFDPENNARHAAGIVVINSWKNMHKVFAI